MKRRTGEDARRPGGRRACIVLIASLLAAVAALPARAQDPPGQPDDPLFDPFTPPIAGTWEPLASLGQPSLWHLTLGVGYGLDRTMAEGEGAGGTVTVGAMRHLFSPVYGALGLSGHIYGGQRGDKLDGGLRLLLESPALLVHLGMDWNARSERTDLLLGTSFPVIRGGLFGRGGEVRVDYLPHRDHSFEAGVTLPLRQPLAGRTRPRQVDVELPPAPPDAEPPSPLGPEAEEAMTEVREAMRWLVDLGNFFWLTENESLGYESTVRQWRQVLQGFREQLDEREGAPVDGTSYEWKVQAYHLALDRAFGRALGASERDAVRVGRPFADRARRKALEEVIIPYNRTIGQYKQPDRLQGLTARARARWTAWAELNPPAVGSVEDARAVLDAWLGDLEALRAGISRLTGDPRMHWLPLALTLRPEEHRTREQIDGIVELALDRGFERGNAVLDVNAVQFQRELIRSLRDTETYHVLWIHDIRGADALGAPDRTGFELVTRGYYRSLIDAVRAYDETGRMPVFMILLDQHFYELNDGRRWMDLLESPLSHRARLPGSHSAWRDEIEALQDTLRAAVEGSSRLRAEARSFGESWVERVVKVHVNITNPSDLSFRSRRLFGPPLGADNLLRDHRKMVIRDVRKDDPAVGEVILAGVGVGDHYASPTWDDRALIVQGPGAAQAIPYARESLERNGLGGDRLPPPLRPRARAPDHASRVAALEAGGATARVLQVHNRTGWGVKDATFVQMLLYDLAPPGTVLYVPDSLWTSFQWMAQLVSAALRGCHVYVVAPALDNAPSAAFPAMSAMQELVSRLVIIDEVFGDRIRAGGGDLRVGLFTREAPLDDLPALVADLDRTLQENAFLRDLFPFDDRTWRWMQAVQEDDGGSRESAASAERFPQMHRKTQWIVDREVLRAVASSPDLSGIVERALARLQEGEGEATEGGPLMAQRRLAPTRELLELLEGVEGLEGRDPILYFATGSLNKNVRSMALDAEALAVVGGPWALQSFFDMAFHSGGVTWVRSLEDVEAHLPPFSPFQRRIGRWLHRVL
jgi:hypothetical protein